MLPDSRKPCHQLRQGVNHWQQVWEDNTVGRGGRQNPTGKQDAMKTETKRPINWEMSIMTYCSLQQHLMDSRGLYDDSCCWNVIINFCEQFSVVLGRTERGWLIDWVRLIVPPTQYKSYGDGFLRVKWPNQPLKHWRNTQNTKPNRTKHHNTSELRNTDNTNKTN